MNFLRKLWQCFFCWKLEDGYYQIAVRNTQVIIAQSFGRRGNQPGVSNEALGRVVAAMSFIQLRPVFLILQWEIADCIPDLVKKGYIICEHREKGKYLDTYEVLVQAWQICQKQGWKKALIVAHPDHHWRVVKTAEKLGFEPIVAETSVVPYDKESIQWWTRSRLRFMAREIPTRLHYLLRGWI